MNILIIPSWYKSKSIPTNGSFFREQAVALQKAGHNVALLNATFRGRKDYFNKDNFRFIKSIDEGVTVYSYVTPAFMIGRNTTLLLKVFYKRIKKMLKKVIHDFGEIDIIHAHSYIPAGYCACLIGNENNIPIVVTEHSTAVLNKSLTEFQISKLKETVESSSSFICVGNSLRSSIIELTDTKKNIEIVPNIVSSIFYNKNCKNSKSEFIFLSAGYLSQQKRFDLLIDAFTEAFKGKQNVKLIICGGGNLYKKLEDKIITLGMSEQIEMTGMVSRDKMATYMQKCGAFVLPSDFETFGVVYIEALACGKPVIGTRNGGAEWIINDENGILIDNNNKEQLVCAMENIYFNINNYDSDYIAEQCKNRYGEDAVVRELERIYKDLTTRRYFL